MNKLYVGLTVSMENVLVQIIVSVKKAGKAMFVKKVFAKSVFMGFAWLQKHALASMDTKGMNVKIQCLIRLVSMESL